MAYIFVADDFTGASDTLGTLARGGLKARLFLDPPSREATGGLDAWGIATHARSLGRSDMQGLAARLGAELARHEPEFLHLKICSTFDGGSETGNYVLMAQGLSAGTGIDDIAVIGGQPLLGRHAVFGTLFARGPDGEIHRLDRHPVMSVHPVTPMDEADLLRHMAALGMRQLERVKRGGRGQAFPRFYDALDQADVEAAGADLRAACTRLLVLGASSVAEAWLAARPAAVPVAPQSRLAKGPVLAFAGSRSSLTTAQIVAAEEISKQPVNPLDIVEGGGALDRTRAWARERLGRGLDCLLWLTADHAGHIAPARLAEASAEFVADVLKEGRAGALVVAGGDTSSAIVRHLAPDWLDYAGDVCPGVPILDAGFGTSRLLMVLKGGQMGGTDFFMSALAAIRKA